MRKILEKDIQRAIIEWLTYKKFLVIKFNNVGIRKPDGGYIPPRQLGISDLLLCSPDGKFWAIEVKNKPNKPSTSQIEFIEQVKKNNGIGFFAYSLDDVVNKYNEIYDKTRSNR